MTNIQPKPSLPRPEEFDSQGHERRWNIQNALHQWGEVAAQLNKPIVASSGGFSTTAGSGRNYLVVLPNGSWTTATVGSGRASLGFKSHIHVPTIADGFVDISAYQEAIKEAVWEYIREN